MTDGTTMSKELALDDREFELFVRGAQSLECDLRSQETEFIAFVLGRLGLRPRELCHIHEGWRRRMIETKKGALHEGERRHSLWKL